jgi:DNA-binding NarL/FixJ family response regulator
MTQQKPYRVLIVDDHEVVRSGIRAILESQAGVEVCCEAANGLEAVEHVRTGKPDLVLLDLTMPEMNGLEVVRIIRQISPESDVLILSMHFSEVIVRETLRAGASGYLLKSDASEELLIALDHLRRGKPYFTSRLAAFMAKDCCHGANTDPACLVGETPLSRREIEILQLLAEGNSNKQIAARLGISTRTVESHRDHIMHKMNFLNLAELIRFALRNNLVAR